jgi:uncharacterized membrane protein
VVRIRLRRRLEIRSVAPATLASTHAGPQHWTPERASIIACMSHPVSSQQHAQPRRLLSRDGPIPLLLVLLMAGGYALLFGTLSIGAYDAFSMHALDMGNMAQAAWNTAHGHLFRFTNMRLNYFGIEAWGTTTRLSFHVEALFPVIALTYLVYPHPETLLVLQTVALAAGAVPVYLLARDALRSAWAGIVFSLAYLLFPTLEATNLYEFHPVALAAPFLLAAFLFARRRQYALFWLFALLAMGTKEEIGLVIAMMGLYIALVRGDRRVGAATVVIGAAWSLAAVLVIEKHYRQPGSLSYVHSRYGYIGHGVHGFLHTVFQNPGAIGNVLFTWPKLGYLERLFAPIGFLCLLAPLALLIGAPTFALNLLSASPSMYTGLGDNSAELVAVVMIAGILGAEWLLATMPERFARLGLGMILVYVLVASLWNQRLNGFTPLGAYYSRPVVGTHQKVQQRFVAMIPPNVPVSTQDQLDPHLADRRYLYLFEDTGREPPTPEVPANLILLDVSAPTYPLPSTQLHDYAEAFIHRPGWGIRAANDGLILIAKGARSRSIPPTFYRFALADGVRPDHSMTASSRGLKLLGYDDAHTDLANHRIPNLAFSIYLRPTRMLRHDLQPAIYELMGAHLVACASHPLGLSWLPTSRWKVGHSYVIRMDPMETQWNTPGTSRLFMELRPALPASSSQSCAALWHQHGKLYPVGTLKVQF